MRKSGLTGDEAYILAKHGETTEDLGPLKKEIGLIKEDVGNLIYKYQENDGYVGYENGIISLLGDTKCTDFLPIKKGMTVKVSGISFEPSDYRGLAIYNKDKIFKNGYQYNKNNEYTFDVSEDGYLRATIVGQQIKVIANQNGIAKALIEVSKDTQKEIKREVNTLISEEYGEEKQLEITETKEGYAVKSDGSKENVSWISCLKFNCAPYQKIFTKNAHAHKNYPWIVLYDMNNNVIGSVNMNEDFSAEIIAPNNASYGWMNCYELVSYAQTQYLIRTIKNECLPEKLKKIISKENPLANLLKNGGYINIFNKIACIGDSLTEGVFEYTENGEVKYAGKPQGFEPYSYPSQLMRMTGATVGNYGVGGATAKSWLETTACTDCFKEENKAQAYIIALGTNDTNYDGDVNTDIDVSNYNNNADTFVGNYAKIIQKCLELQPKAKIFVVTIPKTRTDYHNAWTTGNSKIKAVAEKLGVYVLDIYTYSESFDNPDEYKKHFYSGGHRNAVGYKRTAMEYATYISWIIYNNPNDFRNAQFIETDYEFIN
jgi:lysophospholipase L1-like esterase